MWFSVGSILPDLWRTVANRHLVARGSWQVAEGMLFHRYVDRRYHTSVFFRECYELVDMLCRQESVCLPPRGYFLMHLLVDLMWDCVLARNSPGAVCAAQRVLAEVVAQKGHLAETLRTVFFVNNRKVEELTALLRRMEKDGYFYRLRDVEFCLWLVGRTYERVVGFKPYIQQAVVGLVVAHMEGQVDLFTSALAGYYHEWVEGTGTARSSPHSCQ